MQADITLNIKNDNESSLSYDDNRNKETKSLIETTNNNNKKNTIYLFDLIFNGFFITPLTVIFWTSTWDIFYYFLSTRFFYVNILITFLLCNTILITAYLCQYKLQSYHDRLRAQNPHSGYYGKDFIMRSFYTYILTLAYVLQWITYWDLYNHLTENVHFLYFFGLSVVTILVYNILLKKSLTAFSKTVPFSLQKDIEFDSYFLQSKAIKLDDENSNVIIFILISQYLKLYIFNRLLLIFVIFLELEREYAKLFILRVYRNIFLSVRLEGILGFVRYWLRRGFTQKFC